MFTISVSQLPAATATGAQEVLKENQSVAPYEVWQLMASGGGSGPALTESRRMPRWSRLSRSWRRAAQVFPLPTTSLAEVVAPTARVGRAARAGAGAAATTRVRARVTLRTRTNTRDMPGA